ncbi:MAG: YggS family pyridoxal phosphate-dependent enzyme [Thermodesulfobacteria bacterium]|nr:YggS family pyridoxal phosphate-dependent enzyme [Thermodesulfobacteriota bacterium]
MCERLEQIRAHVEEACRRSGRNPDEITVVAVSKRKPASMIRELFNCGQRVFGENYVQEGVAKVEELADLHEIKWHFIGHLQRNKAKLAVQHFDWIETVDSERLANALNKRAQELNKCVNVLVQVNIGQEESKYGVMKEDVPPLLEHVHGLSNLKLKGLMTIHPVSSSKEEARKWFRQMAALKRELEASYPEMDLSELSMGMSRDYDIAIEEGATIVRIGTALFGPRE